jgi:hypothetical protein
MWPSWMRAVSGSQPGERVGGEAADVRRLVAAQLKHSSLSVRTTKAPERVDGVDALPLVQVRQQRADRRRGLGIAPTAKDVDGVLATVSVRSVAASCLGREGETSP